mgnify:FL=1|tara:strand:+ start:205 stop:1260 length:1056 start_codon:yes stop_codon:yes gene_type:complete
MLLSRLAIILLLILTSCAAPKKCCSQVLKKTFKFSTFYIAANGNTSLADRDIYSVKDGSVLYDTVFTPFDYSLVMGIRKIKRFGYEDITKFKDGTESAYGDAASVGLSPFEYLFQANYKRQEGVEYLDQHHFVRYVKPKWLSKVEYIKDGFADIEYFESTQRLRLNGNKKLSFNIGAVQRLAEPYGFDPLEQWQLENNYLHYTCLAIEEGYSADVYENEYKDPDGNIVATSADVWKQVVIPEVLENYVEKKRNELANQWQHSLVVGFDYYYYKKNFWLHGWGNLMPYHYDDGNEFSYHNFNDGEQWYDYSGGLIVGAKITKHLGMFVEGKYNKYWNREWYDFKCGINYVIF